MDTQLAQIKYCNKNENEIVYPHNGELIIYRKERNENGKVNFTEIRVNTETNVTVKRKMNSDEMTEEQFDIIKPILDEETRTSFNQDWLETYQNICFDALEETDLACVPSPEAEMIDEMEKRKREKLESHNPLRRTLINAKTIMNSCLTPAQKSRFIKYNVDEMSTHQIAEKEEKNQKSIHESIKAAEKKIEKQKNILLKAHNTPSKRPKNLYR